MNMQFKYFFTVQCLTMFMNVQLGTENELWITAWVNLL